MCTQVKKIDIYYYTENMKFTPALLASTRQLTVFILYSTCLFIHILVNFEACNVAHQEVKMLLLLPVGPQTHVCG